MNEATGQLVIDFNTATRKSHPDTSRIAEKKITKSGKRRTHCQIILACLHTNNGSTSSDLAFWLLGKLTHAQIWRRRKDLVENGYIKVSGVRNGYGIWWIL